MIGEALAFGGANGRDCAGFIIPAQRLTMIVSEIEFSLITV